VIVQGLRRIRQWSYRGRPSGMALVRLLTVVCILMPAWCFAEWKIPQLPATAGKWSQRCRHFGDRPSMLQRDDVYSQLLAEGGKHLVVVRYAVEGFTHSEWVYNRADIDNAPVVWARYREGVPLKPLLEYFHDRKAWIVTIVGYDSELRPLELMSSPSETSQSR
jgi:hypothetical protein